MHRYRNNILPKSPFYERENIIETAGAEGVRSAPAVLFPRGMEMGNYILSQDSLFLRGLLCQSS
jgi:hypothetical protein